MKGKARILIIDDEVSFARLLKLNLEQTGAYEVRTEHQGALGLVAARAFKPDLILCDMIMPDVGGSEVASRIKAERGCTEIPIVFLTAAVSREQVASQGGVIGGHPFIAKPVTVEDVIRHIEEHLARSPARGAEQDGGAHDNTGAHDAQENDLDY